MENLEYEIEHFGISVSNLKASIIWYENLGFQKIKEFGKSNLEIKGATLKFKNSLIELLEPYSKNPSTSHLCMELKYQLQRLGANHIAFATSDLNAVYNRLMQNNSRVITEFNESSTLLFCLDPDNTLIEFRKKS